MTTNQTNFQKVRDFNIAFGISRSDEENPDVFDQSPNLVKLRLDLIQEETEELDDAYNKMDFVEIVDALADIEYVVHGCADSFGIDLDKYLEKQSEERSQLMTTLRTSVPPKVNSTQFLNQSMGLVVRPLNQSFVYLLGKHQEIVNCLESTFEKKDFQDTIRLLVKLYDSVTQMSSCLGFDIDYVFAKVHQSNMSKLCSSQEEAQASLEKYQNDPEKRYDSPAIRQSALEGKLVVYNQSTGKALKSHLYKAVTDDIVNYLHQILNRQVFPSQ